MPQQRISFPKPNPNVIPTGFFALDKQTKARGFATKEWEVGVHRVVVKITTVLDCAFAVMEKFATKE